MMLEYSGCVEPVKGALRLYLSDLYTFFALCEGCAVRG
ncbi:hypothetical protein GEOBRER4_n0919 [Citrifermentans bremense]|uniref:Uncharacterized protein n=1 Tax=Citrifermentans bremense TaxID=60035 RepID=A0A7R7FSU2_9BACT|nr:hypothetical protein GEOBRER4_n0919 [Citrifermentans bremense]